MASGRILVEFLVIALALSWQSPGVQAQLKVGYYDKSCPNVEQLVRNTFVTQMNLIKIITAPAALLRLVFHDCAGGGGCDASIMLESQGSITDEKLSGRNLGISNLDVIDTIKTAVENACASTVSCADILAMVGREAVNFAGGPRFDIVLGREDGLTASTEVSQRSLLPATATVDEVLSVFARMGINTEEAVSLLGAHTLGVAHCENIENRLYPQPDATLSQFSNVAFYNQLRTLCPQFFKNPNTVVAMDATNTFFDTRYFTDAATLSRGLLSIDDALAKDDRTKGYMLSFQNRQTFFNVFARAYDKMTRYNVLTGGQGQIRKNCRYVN